MPGAKGGSDVPISRTGCSIVRPVHSDLAWLDNQERMLRDWLAEATRNPSVDEGWLERLQAHHRWLQAERDSLSAPSRCA